MNLGESVIANLHHTLIVEDIARLQIAVNDAMIVQVRNTSSNTVYPEECSFGRHARRIRRDHLVECLPRNKFHDDPIVALSVFANIKYGQQIRMLQVQTVSDALNSTSRFRRISLNRHFLAGVGSWRNRLRSNPPCPTPRLIV